MQKIILAAGKCSRFWPINNSHKSNLRLLGKTILKHTIDSVNDSGIKDIIVVKSGKNNMDLPEGVTTVIQKNPLGMGDAILCAKNEIINSFFVLNANHINVKNAIAKCIDSKEKNSSNIVLAGAKTNMPQLYGVFEFDGVFAKKIIEKPKTSPPSDIRVVGVYLLSKEFINTLEKTEEEEYSFETALTECMKINKVPVVVLKNKDENPSLKYPWHLFDILKMLFDSNEQKTTIAKNAIISKSATIDDSKGAVIIGDNTKVMECAVIRGPAYIGKNCLVGNNAIVRDYSNLEDNVKIGANCEIARSIIQDDVHIHSGFVGDSIIDSGTRIGAGIITANKRIDRGEIIADVKGTKTNTGITGFGCVVGRNSKIGVSVKTMPGVMIGADTVIGSGTVVEKNIFDNTKYYTKFKENIEKRG